VGSGPLDGLLGDPAVNEIMINGPEEIFVERDGRIERVETKFRDANHLMAFIERLLEPARASVTETNPCVDASLPDGSRINVIIPPLVLNGPTVTIRRKLRRWEMNDLVYLESLSPEAAEFLEACVKARVNVILSGGTSTGKTALVSILSSFIPQEERIITIENVAELDLPNRQHWIKLVSRSPNAEGRGEIPLRTLVRNALRMRPDRVILGEARGGEALDVVQAMQTGHEGVITVLHANSPQAALERLETLMLMSGVDVLAQACRTQIARAVDVVVHLARFADGSRRIASIAHVLDTVSGGFQIEELFAFDVKGFRPDGKLEGTLRYTGARPKFLPKFQVNNVPIPRWMDGKSG
jgi:pilus assembly protein CpaF